jgi:hypothetical protein
MPCKITKLHGRQQYKQQQHKNQNLWHSNNVQDAGEKNNCIVIGHTACMGRETCIQEFIQKAWGKRPLARFKEDESII